MVTVKEALAYIKQYCILRNLSSANFDDSMVLLCDAADRGEIPSLHIKNGATKGVIIFDDADFVVKIPFRVYNSRPLTKSLAKRKWDYCQREADLFIMAVEAGFDKFFAKTEFAGFVKRYPIYVQTRLTDIGECNCWDTYDNAAPKVRKQAQRLYYARTTGKAGIYTDLAAALIVEFGYRATQRFMNFCVRIDTGEDWHAGNYGKCPDTGALVFCDYTGFRM